MNKRIVRVLCLMVCLLFIILPVSGAEIPRTETPDYKVAFYASDHYHIKEDDRYSGYGYEMMQGLAQYMQCTFSYVGYDKTPQECEELLRQSELDLYTAARPTEARKEEFAISVHPAITAMTCMNVKVGNQAIIAGDYSTYEGIKVGLQKNHTYNVNFIEFAEEKGFSCELVYYNTPTELGNALINGEVDATLGSYIRIPEDEKKIEDFGATPYYIMARKEHQALIDQIDAAFDVINEQKPGWRSSLYNKYYGYQEESQDLTAEEQELLDQWIAEKRVIRAVMNPDAAPYSWYEDGKARGIASYIFQEAAQKLGIPYEIIAVDTKQEYKALIATGQADVWLDVHDSHSEAGCGKYKLTDSYFTSAVSVLQHIEGTGEMRKIAAESDAGSIKRLCAAIWPEAEILEVSSVEECRQMVLDGTADAAVLMSYTAQKLAKEEVQNRLHAEIISGAEVLMQMGVHAAIDVRFFDIWNKALNNAAEQIGDQMLQVYADSAAVVTMSAYLFDHPVYLVTVSIFLFLILFLTVLYVQSVGSKRKQKKIAGELTVALAEAKKANEAKQEFFSKMSHDIRTPLNVVLGMTQIAQKCKTDMPKLENALDSIALEGNYLLMLINSILDVNQLEYGSVELVHEPFDLEACMKNNIELLRPLAQKKEQELDLVLELKHKVVLGDANRFSQIVINVLSNAIKYTDTGGSIHVWLKELSGQRYQFICEDNGIGMTEEYVQHICEMYSRAEDSRVSKIQGTGLGMAVVRGFTELMNGTLKIDSEPGKGSVFTIELPFAGISKEQEAKLYLQKKEIPQEFAWSGKKALIVEDNELNAEISRTLLENLGLQVDTAENGEIGLQKYLHSQAGEYYVIFMDVQMPVMDGVEATRIIRSSHRQDSDIPIFAMTANMFSSDKRKYKEAGMDGYIAKPISNETIRKVLEEKVIGV